MLELLKMLKDRRGDLFIHLIGAAIVGLVGWFAALAAEKLHISLVVVVVIATAVSVVVIGLVFLVVQGRQLASTQAKLGLSAQAAATYERAVRDLRSAHMRIVEQLQVADEWSVRELIASYTVDPAGKDRCESVWTLAFKGPEQGRVFTIEDATAQAADEDVNLICTYDAAGSIVTPVLLEDEPTSKRWAVHLHPPVGTTRRQLEVVQTWPGLWNDLRQTGTDYYELTARPGLQKAQIVVYVPMTMGEFEWGPSPSPQVSLARVVSGAQQTLTMTVNSPDAGRRYRVDVVRKVARTT